MPFGSPSYGEAVAASRGRRPIAQGPSTLASVAKGATNFVTAFMGASEKEEAAKLERQKFESLQALRQAQMAQWDKEYKPKVVDFSLLGELGVLANENKPGAKQLLTLQVKKIANMEEGAAKQAALRSFITYYKQPNAGLTPPAPSQPPAVPRTGDQIAPPQTEGNKIQPKAIQQLSGSREMTPATYDAWVTLKKGQQQAEALGARLGAKSLESASKAELLLQLDKFKTGREEKKEKGKTERAIIKAKATLAAAEARKGAKDKYKELKIPTQSLLVGFDKAPEMSGVKSLVSHIPGVDYHKEFEKEVDKYLKEQRPKLIKSLKKMYNNVPDKDLSNAADLVIADYKDKIIYGDALEDTTNISVPWKGSVDGAF